MLFNEYVELASRTNKERELHLLNEDAQVLHGVMGLVTELQELKEAVEKLDTVNIVEEIGDMFWYLHLFYDTFGFPYPVPEDDVIKKELGSIITVNHCIISMEEFIADLTDYTKRKLFYGKCWDENEIENAIDAISYYLETLANRVGGLDVVFEKNISKLKARYPEGFTNDDAINRDVEKEREVLEK